VPIIIIYPKIHISEYYYNYDVTHISSYSINIVSSCVTVDP